MDKANLKYGEAVNNFKAQREKIDILRRERVMFEQMYMRLENELGVKRKDMASLIEEVG